MEAFLKEKKFQGVGLRTLMEQLGHGDGVSIQLDALSLHDSIAEADLAWHVRAWGRWVLARARKELAAYYPTYAAFQPQTPGLEYETRPLRLLEVDEEGIPRVDRSTPSTTMLISRIHKIRVGSPNRRWPISGRVP